MQWRIQGGGQGVRPPPFGPRCKLFNIGPKVGPPLGPPPPFSCRPKMTPVADPGCVCVTGVLVNVQEWGCFSNFLRADDVTRTMSKGGACEKSCIRAWTPPPLSKILDPPLLCPQYCIIYSSTSSTTRFADDTSSALIAARWRM